MILVTGGTGFVGRKIVKQLLADGHQVRLLARNPIPARTLFHAANCDIVEGDILQPASLATACAGVQAVVHLVGIIRQSPGASFAQIHEEGTRNILSAATAAGVKRFLHMSALGTRPHAVSNYHRSKWVAEECVRHSTLLWTIFRPSLIYGPDDAFSTMIIHNARRGFGLVPCPDNGQTILQPIVINDVALAFSRALANAQAVGKTYDLCGEPVTLKEILQQLCQAHQIEPHFLPIPSSVVKPLAWLAELLLPITPLTYDQAIMLEEDHHGDYLPAMQDLGVIPGDFEENIQRQQSQVELALA